MAEEIKKVIPISYSYDEDDGSLEIDFDNGGSLHFEDGREFILNVMDGLWEHNVPGEFKLGEVSFVTEENGTLTIESVKGIDRTDFNDYVEMIYEEENL